MMPIVGLGPHGECGAPLDQLEISEAATQAARRGRFRVAIVLHTTASDWAKQELEGISATLQHFDATIINVIDCGFRVEAQIEALKQLARSKLDAVISIPIGGSAISEAHRNISLSGIKLILLDNGPTSLLPGTDYVSVISSDNFGLGTIGAQLLTPHIPIAGKVGVLSYKADFFATNEREIAFRKWIESDRPDVKLKAIKFSDVGLIAAALNGFLDANPDTSGLFAVWDVPALEAVHTLRSRSQYLPVTTVDLGNEVATALAQGDLIKGVAAQRAYDQGAAVAKAAISSLVGIDIPPWIVLPGLATTAANVMSNYRTIWHAAPPLELERAYQSAAANLDPVQLGRSG